jgi:hypothetical protein
MGDKTNKVNKPEQQNLKATYRVLAEQRISVNVQADAEVVDLSIQGLPCRIAIQPIYQDPAKQRELGGSLLVIEFEEDVSADILAVARDGLELIEDFLSAIAVIEGITFAPCKLIQVARKEGVNKHNCDFLQFIEVPATHWARPITAETLHATRHMLAHWDGLESGKRLRRAARQYREAIGNFDDVLAFQEAYIGLETMEKPLAEMVGLEPGTELTSGHCESCGFEFTRRKTSLVGVKSFVLDDLDQDAAEAGRKADWKLINRLRNELFHGLVDTSSLGKRAHEGLVAAMHHLHRGICICSHAANFLSEKYVIARGGAKYAIYGEFTETSWPPLSNWVELISTSELKWVPHAQLGFVPALSIRHDGHQDLQIAFLTLTEPISFATMRSLKQANVETNLESAE